MNDALARLLELCDAADDVSGVLMTTTVRHWTRRAIASHKCPTQLDYFATDFEAYVAASKQRCLEEWANVNDPPCHPSDADWRPCQLCEAPRTIANEDFA